MVLPSLLLVIVGMISCYHHLHLASFCSQRHAGDLGWRVRLIHHYHHLGGAWRIDLCSLCLAELAYKVVLRLSRMMFVCFLSPHWSVMVTALASGRSPHGEDPVAVGVIVTMSAPFAHCPSVLLFVAVAAVIAAAASSLLLVHCWLLPGCC